MCPTDSVVAPAGSLPYHYGSPQRHWVYTGPLVIVSTAMDAYYTDGIGVYPLRCIHGEDEDAYPILRSQKGTHFRS